MRILDVPARLLAIHSVVTLIFTVLIFLPGIIGFGSSAVAADGIVLGFEFPFLGVLGSITIMQVASYLLGGIFSFMLAYMFSKSFLPSLTASFAYNFSILHFQGAVLDLGLLLVFAFLPLFLISYFRDSEKILLPASLLLVALGDLAVGGLCGFFVFMDMLMKKKRAPLALLAFLALSLSAFDIPQEMMGVEFLAIFLPSAMMLMSVITGGFAGAGIYLGLGVSALVASSIIIKGAGREERYFLGWFLFSLFMFTLILLAGMIIPIKHVSVGFVLLALLFLTPLTALFFERIFRKEKYGVIVLALIAVGSVIERWPIVWDYLISI